MLTRNSAGQVIRSFTYSGPMRKHGGDRETRKDATIATLDRIASVRVRYGPTLRVRKHA